MRPRLSSDRYRFQSGWRGRTQSHHTLVQGSERERTGQCSQRSALPGKRRQWNPMKRACPPPNSRPHAARHKPHSSNLRFSACLPITTTSGGPQQPAHLSRVPPYVFRRRRPPRRCAAPLRGGDFLPLLRCGLSTTRDTAPLPTARRNRDSSSTRRASPGYNTRHTRVRELL